MFAITLNEYNLPYPEPITSPIHPITVHFVIAMVVFSVLFDFLGHFQRRESFLNVGWWNLATATAAVIVAVFFGQLEAGFANYSKSVQPVLDWHTVIGWSLSAILVILALWRGFLRYRNPLRLNVPYLGAGLAVVGLVFYQTVLGTQLVWQYGLHVKPVVEASRQQGGSP